MSEIHLTLDDTPQMPITPVERAAEIQQIQSAEDAKGMLPKFTPEEQQMIDEFSKKIDLRDANLVYKYGAGTQKNLVSFSDGALNSVRSKDLGEVGNMIGGLVAELHKFSIDPEES